MPPSTATICAGDVRGGGREQEGRHAAHLGRIAVAPQRHARDGLLLAPPRRGRRPARRGRSSRVAVRSVATRPGAMPLMRTGAISGTSDLIRPASPGRSRFDVVSAGIGSRTDDERMTQIGAAGSRLADSDGSAARSSRTRRPEGHVQRALPGRVVDLAEAAGRRTAHVDQQQVETAEALRRPRRPPLRARLPLPGRPRSRAHPARRPVAVSRSEARAATATFAPSSVSARATAAPSPAEPPVTSARAPCRPRSTPVR